MSNALVTPELVVDLAVGRSVTVSRTVTGSHSRSHVSICHDPLSNRALLSSLLGGLLSHRALLSCLLVSFLGDRVLLGSLLLMLCGFLAGGLSV